MTLQEFIAFRQQLGWSGDVEPIVEIERTFELLLSDEAMVYPYWKRLVAEQRVTGRRVFDARLVAVMLAHGIDRLLTFNAADFAGLGVPVLEPQTVSSI